MVIIETPYFTQRITELLTDDEYARMQNYLREYPDAGDVIVGSGGLRKLRWSMPGRGKRGGMRVVYYWLVADSQLWMLTLYAKNEADDLTARQLQMLRAFVEAATR